MSNRKSFDDAFELSRYWDAFLRGERDPEPGALDADSISFVIEFQRTARLATPAGTGEQALDAVMNEITTRLAAQNGKGTHVNRSVVLTRGATPWIGQGETRRQPDHQGTFRSRGLSWAGAAAIAVIVLASLFFIIRNEHRAELPALTGTATPGPAPAPAGTDWFTYKGGNSRTSATDEPGPTGELQVLWSFENAHGMRDPIVSNGTVYSVDRCSDLYAYSAETGAQLWSVYLGFPTPSAEYPNFCSPTVVGGVVYVGSYSGWFYALNADDGSVQWSFQSGSSILTSPVVADGAVVFATDAGDLLAVDASDGLVKWTYKSGGVFYFSAPSFDGSTLVIPNQKGEVVGLRITDGKVRWKTQLDSTRTATAAIANGLVYVPADEGVLYALDSATGSEVWRYEVPGGFGYPPAVGNGVVVVNSKAGVQALDAGTGAHLWSGPKVDWQVAIAGGSVYLPTSINLEERDLRSGALLFTSSLGAMRMTPAIVDGVLIVGSDTGVSAYGTKRDTPALVTAATPPADISVATPVATPTGLRQVAKATFEWSAYGRPDDPFSEGWLVRVAPDGTIWAVDDSKRAFIYNSDGTLLEIWEGEDSGPIFTFAPDGSFYTVDPATTKVRRYSADRELIAKIGTAGSEDGQFLSPESLVILPDGSLMISDSARGDVQHLSADGIFLGKFDGSGSPGGVLQHPGMMAMDSGGNLYIVESEIGRIRSFDQSGNEIREIAGREAGVADLSEPYDIAINAVDDVLVADQSNNRVLLLNTSGELAFEWGELGVGDGEFQKPGSVAFGEDGAVYVIDWYGARLEKFTLEGSFTFSPVLH